jgi:hypothetical protein
MISVVKKNLLLIQINTDTNTKEYTLLRKNYS